MKNMSNEVQISYDRIADEYALRIYDELRHKPLDRELLDRFAERVGNSGTVCDMGCGPGQVARYLQERGVSVCGIDLSQEMVESARRLNPGIPFQQGDMLSLEVADEAWDGIAAFYSLLHIPRPQIGQALAEFKRVLKPGGLLLTAFHIGEGAIHRNEMWGQAVNLDFLLFHSEEMAEYLSEAGFTAEEVIEREPYPEVEHPSRRAYIFAVKPIQSVRDTAE